MSGSRIGAASQPDIDDEGKRGANARNQPPRLVVCAETVAATTRIMPHAKVIALALDAELMLLHVVEAHNTQYSPADPVEWELCCREAEAFVSALSEQYGSEDHVISTKVMQGRTSEQIAACMDNDLVDIVALCRSDTDDPGKMGHTARLIVERTGGSILMIPASSEGAAEPLYRRLLVPLDGSARAEAAIPVAKRIALDQGAEIVLAHAVADPFLIQLGPLEQDDIELRDRLRRRNERVAHDYLARQCEQAGDCGMPVSMVILVGGDARRQLSRAIASESADLVVMSSHGNSGHADVSTGDTADFLLANSTAPVLMMRLAQHNGNAHIHVSTQSNGVRQPTGAS